MVLTAMLCFAMLSYAMVWYGKYGMIWDFNAMLWAFYAMLWFVLYKSIATVPTFRLFPSNGHSPPKTTIYKS